VLNTKITGPETIAQLGTESYRKDYVTLIGRRGTTGTVNGLAEVHISELGQKENRHLIALVRAFQRQTASAEVAIANVPDEFAPLVATGVREGLLLDAMVVGRGSLRDEGIFPLNPESRLYKNKVYEVQLDSPATSSNIEDDQDEDDDFSPRR
jgi:hypothetical protein